MASSLTGMYSLEHVDFSKVLERSYEQLFECLGIILTGLAMSLILLRVNLHIHNT